MSPNLHPLNYIYKLAIASNVFLEKENAGCLTSNLTITRFDMHHFFGNVGLVQCYFSGDQHK